MRLTKAMKRALDLRFTSYDPDQEVETEEGLVNLCCPLHGPYKATYRKLRGDYLKRHLKSPQCPECNDSKYNQKSVQVREAIAAAVNELKWGVPDSTHPDYRLMEHWT